MLWVKNICRLCGQTDEIPYRIFNTEDNLEEKIKKCLNLEVCKEDFKPKQLCSSCYGKLSDFSNFIDVCYATNLKFESIYYTESWHQNDTILYEPDNTTNKQSVIVSNRQCQDHNSQFYRQPNNDSIEILPNSTNLNQPETILDFSVNYNNIQTDDIPNCFNECSSFDKQRNINTASVKEEVLYTQSEKTVNSCLVNENDPSELLDSVENEPNRVITQVNPSRVLKSVEEVRKSLETDSKLIETQHSNLKPKKSFPCPHCEKIFVRRTNLNAHISFHTKIRPYKCSTCSKSFAVKCHLTQHQKTHLDIFVCQICHKNFDVPSKLSRHMQTHNKNKPFVCNFPDCNKSFSDKDNLKQHILIHSTEKNFCCVICMKQFKTRKNLKAHVTSHVNIGKFQCEFCEKVFKYKHNLKTHLLKHSNATFIII